MKVTSRPFAFNMWCIPNSTVESDLAQGCAMTLTRDNHFVPQLYLRNFSSDSSKVHEYLTLVSRPRVPLWKTVDVAGTGYETDLYTRIVQGKEADDIEQWMNRDFETPACEAIQNVLADRDLTQDDWNRLVRLLAAQIVRTPAFLVKNFKIWGEQTKLALRQSHNNLERRLLEAKAKGEKLVPKSGSTRSYIPLRFAVREIPDHKKVQLVTTVLVGRGHWFQAMEVVLTSTVKVLHKHKWSIVEAPAGLPWFTSDDPVICLNYRSPTDYDFNAGWGVPRANILFPLSPRHMMLTQVEANSYPRRVPSRHIARVFRGIIAQHAYRRIYSSEREEKIPYLRPRIVDEKLFRQERIAWRNWYESQNEAEKQFWDESQE